MSAKYRTGERERDIKKKPNWIPYIKDSDNLARPNHLVFVVGYSYQYNVVIISVKTPLTLAIHAFIEKKTRAKITLTPLDCFSTSVLFFLFPPAVAKC